MTARASSCNRLAPQTFAVADQALHAHHAIDGIAAEVSAVIGRELEPWNVSAAPVRQPCGTSKAATPGRLPLTARSSGDFKFLGVFELVDSPQECLWIGPPAERSQRPVFGFPGNYALPVDLDVHLPEGIHPLHTTLLWTF
jgi:hypothetical protein